MFGIGPTELAFFLVIVLLAVGPDRLPTFMRTVGRGLRQVRNASREFKDAIGLDDLMREGDPFRAPPVRPPRARPVPLETQDTQSSQDAQGSQDTAKASAETLPPPVPEAAKAQSVTPPPATSAASSAPAAPTASEAEPTPEPDASAKSKQA